MGTYVVGDIHGCYDEWMALKNQIEMQDCEATFILVGDIVDRGPKVMEMIDWAMANITENGKYQMICGNHELEKMEWFAEFLEYRELYPEEDYRDYFPDNYDFKSTLEKNNVPLEQVQNIIRFFMELPFFKECYIDTGKKKGRQHYVIVHAYLPPDCINKDGSVKKTALTYPKNCVDTDRIARVMEKQSKVVWERNYNGYDQLKNTIVLHGHTPTLIDDIFATRSEKGRICYQKNDINLDCGLVFRIDQSNLAAIRLEDLQEFYLYPVNEEPEGKYGWFSRWAQKLCRAEHLDLIHGKRSKS